MITVGISYKITKFGAAISHWIHLCLSPSSPTAHVQNPKYSTYTFVMIYLIHLTNTTIRDRISGKLQHVRLNKKMRIKEISTTNG